MTGQKIAIDVGTSNITVYTEGKGIVICEPCCAAEDSKTGRLLAYGLKAEAMAGRTPASVRIVRPVENGKISDYKKTVKILRSYLNRVCRGRIFRPNVIMCVSGTVTVLERKTLFEAVMEAGAGRVCFVDQALASIIGAGVPVYSAQGHMICDIGASYTDCAAVAGGNITHSVCVNVGGKDFNDCLRSYVFRNMNAEIADETAEKIKKMIGSAVKRDEELAIEVCGKDIFNFCPRNFEITSNDVIAAFETPLSQICAAVTGILESVTPELSADILDNGIVLTGGSSGIFGLNRLIEKKTGVKTVCAESPELCAALGMGKLLGQIEFLTKHNYLFRDSKEETVDD